MHVPVLMIYSNYTYFADDASQPGYLSLSLGNLGFTESKCIVDTINKPSIQLQCTTGTIASVSDFGITTQFEDQQACSRKDTTQYCYQFFKGTQFRKEFGQACVGQKECSISKSTSI